MTFQREFTVKITVESGLPADLDANRLGLETIIRNGLSLYSATVEVEEGPVLDMATEPRWRVTLGKLTLYECASYQTAISWLRDNPCRGAELIGVYAPYMPQTL